MSEWKEFREMQTDYIDKHYNEHRGVLVKKYRNLFGKYIFIIDENEMASKIYVGKCIYEDTELGAQLTIGEIDSKLINIRPGICKNTDI